MSFNFVSGWRAGIDRIIDAKMNEAMQAGIAAEREAAPVDTGNLQSLLGGHYDQKTKTITYYGDAPYTVFQDQGFTARNGRKVPGKHFMAKAVAATARVFGGNGVEVQFATAPEKYHKRTIVFTRGKVGRARLVLGHKRPGRR